MPRLEDGLIKDASSNITVEEAANCEKIVEPNKMVYVDAEGVQHAIHMPKGTFQTAIQHYAAKNFDELAKFPAWANQTYDDEEKK